jgi:hypothetical protein
MEKYVHLKTSNDYLKYVASSFASNVVTDGETIPAGSCAYNDTLKSFRINDSASTKGVLNIPLGFLEIGDKVDIEVEVMNLSGTKAKIAVDYYSDKNYSTIDTNWFIYQSENGNQFQRFGGSFVSTKAKYGLAIIGLFTADAGDFYLRNVNIKITTNRSLLGDVLGSYRESKRMYTFKGSAGGFSLQTGYTNDTCTFTIDSTAKELTITHDKPFTHFKLGTSISNVSATSDFKYLARTRSESANSFRVKFYDMDNKTILDPAVLALDTNFWFSAIHFGYDYD